MLDNLLSRHVEMETHQDCSSATLRQVRKTSTAMLPRPEVLSGIVSLAALSFETLLIVE